MKFKNFTVYVIIRTYYTVWFGTCSCTQDLYGIHSFHQGNTTGGGAGDQEICDRGPDGDELSRHSV